MSMLAKLVVPFVSNTLPWLQQHPLGYVYYVCVLTLWTVLCLPITPIEIAAGFVFPFPVAVFCSGLGKSLGSISAFFVARICMQPCFHGAAGASSSTSQASTLSSGSSGSPTRHTYAGGCMSKAYTFVSTRIDGLLQPLQHALRTHPMRTCFLVRAAPLPMSLKNYGLGMVQNLPAMAFIVPSTLVNIPFSIAWALAGNSASSLQEAINGESQGNAQRVLLLLVACVAIFVALSVVARKAKAQLDAISESDSKLTKAR